MTARILIADDHAVLRAGLRLLIDNEPDLEVVAEAENGTEALQKAEALHPDVVLLDINMPVADGLSTLPALHSSLPDTRVLMLTMHDDAHYLQEALSAGAAGYVLKKAADKELLMAIRATLRGETYIHSAMTQKLLDNVMHPDTAPQEEDPWQALSEREHDVLRLVALGYTNSEIAGELFLSVKTVETYRARGMEKLGLETRAQLVRSALEHGYMD